MFCTSLEEMMGFCASEKSGQGCLKTFASILLNFLQSFWNTAAFLNTTYLVSLQTVASPACLKRCLEHLYKLQIAVTFDSNHRSVLGGNGVSVLQMKLEYWTSRWLLFPPQSKIAFPHIPQLYPGTCNQTYSSINIHTISCVDTWLNEDCAAVEWQGLVPWSSLDLTFKNENQMTE